MKGKFFLKLIIHDHISYLMKTICLIFLDNFVLLIIYCCIFAVFSSKPKVNDTKLSYSGMVRNKPKPKLPDNRYFDWELCKVPTKNIVFCRLYSS